MSTAASAAAVGGPVLVCGFGAFLEIADNPAARLARALDGALLSDGGRIVGREMPVSYTRAPQVTRDWVAQLAPRALVGIGVARGRAMPCIETQGVSSFDPLTPDVDGCCQPEGETQGPPVAHLSAPAQALAQALGAVVSDDAGRYVCNGWIYAMALSFPADLTPRLPTTFIHIPPSGLAPQDLYRALDLLWGGGRDTP